MERACGRDERKWGFEWSIEIRLLTVSDLMYRSGVGKPAMSSARLVSVEYNVLDMMIAILRNVVVIMLRFVSDEQAACSIENFRKNSCLKIERSLFCGILRLV